MNPTPKTSIDTVGTEVYTAHYSERRVFRLATAVLGVIATVQTGAIVHLANKPPVTHYVRINEISRATAIAYNDLTYTPREGEIRTFLTDWATYRYTMLRDSVAKSYHAITTSSRIISPHNSWQPISKTVPSPKS